VNHSTRFWESIGSSSKLKFLHYSKNCSSHFLWGHWR